MPSQNAVHQDAALENISVAYRPQGLISNELVPTVPVKKESDKYYVYSKDNLRVPETLRADGAEANEVDWALSTASYALDEHSLKHLVTQRQRDNADTAIRPDVDATEMLTDHILLRGEKDLADVINVRANWANATSLTSTFAWSAQTSLSNPISFADSATTVILQNSGKRANRALLDERTFKVAKEHPSVVDRVKYTSADSITAPMLARLFNVEKVIVGSSVYNSAQEGLTDSMSFLFTDLAFFCYMEPNPGLKKPSAFYTLEQSGLGLQGGAAKVTRYPEQKRGGDFVEVTRRYIHKVVASDCAYHIADTVQ